MNLGKRIVKIRKDNKMSQEEFSEVLGVTRQTVSNWENSKNYPDIETLILISDKFNISLDILLKNDKEMVKDIDNKIRKNKVLKSILYIFLIIIFILVILVILFHNQIIEYLSGEDITYKPGVLIGCTYKDEFVEYHVRYNKITKRPIDGANTIGRHKEMLGVSKKIATMKTSDFKNVNELEKYVKTLYEEAGANCKVVYYNGIDEYDKQVVEMQMEFLDSLD